MSTPLRSIQGGRDERPEPAPPNNLAVERAVLATTQLDRRALAKARSLGLTPKHFYDPANGRMWEGLVALADSPDATTDALALQEWLRARGWLERVGGTDYLVRVFEQTPLTGALVSHVKILLQLARVRAVLAEAQVIVAEARGDIGDPDEWLAAASPRIAARSEASKATSLSSFAETLKETWETITRPLGERGGYPTWLDAFDSATGGLYPGEVLLVSAKEKAGKSVLVGQWAAALSRHPYQVLDATGAPVLDEKGAEIWRKRGAAIFALEGKKTDWAERVASADALIDLEGFRLGTATDDDRKALSLAIDDVSSIPVFVDREHVSTVAQMGARVRALRDDLAAKGIDLSLVAIDYIQLAAGEGRTREEQVGAAMRAVVGLASQEDLKGIAWIVISQVNADGGLFHCSALAKDCDAWIHLSVEDDKETTASFASARGQISAPVYPARLEVKRHRRARMGARAKPIAFWCCYKFTFFYDGA